MVYSSVLMYSKSYRISITPFNIKVDKIPYDWNGFTQIIGIAIDEANNIGANSNETNKKNEFIFY